MNSELVKELCKSLSENKLAYILVCALSALFALFAWLGKTSASRIARREEAAIREGVYNLSGPDAESVSISPVLFHSPQSPSAYSRK